MSHAMGVDVETVDRQVSDWKTRHLCCLWVVKMNWELGKYVGSKALKSDKFLEVKD